MPLISVIKAITIGASHIRDNLECQDHLKCIRKVFLDKELVIAAVADGVGSCLKSAVGSEVAVCAATEYIAKSLSQINSWDDDVLIKIVNASFSSAYYAIQDRADKEEVSLFSLSTTLTLAVYDGDHLVFGHAGDSGLIVLYDDGSYEMITTRKKGDTRNSVIPLNGDYKEWQFGSTKKSVAAFTVMTDGLLDYGVKYEDCDNAIYFPVYGNYLLSRISNENDEMETSKDLLDWISSSDLREKVTDDISVIAVANQEKIGKVEKIVAWDEEKWKSIIRKNMITPEAKAEALYGDFKKAKKEGTLGKQQSRSRLGGILPQRFRNGNNGEYTIGKQSCYDNCMNNSENNGTAPANSRTPSQKSSYALPAYDKRFSQSAPSTSNRAKCSDDRFSKDPSGQKAAGVDETVSALDSRSIYAKNTGSENLDRTGIFRSSPKGGLGNQSDKTDNPKISDKQNGLDQKRTISRFECKENLSGDEQMGTASNSSDGIEVFTVDSDAEN